MIVPDANLLIYAYNVASPHHPAALTWWETCLSGTELVGLTYPTIFAFVRVTTATQAYSKPLTLEESKQCVAEWMERAVIRILMPGSNYFEEVFRLLESAGSSGGNFVSDAQIAALAMAYKATIHTADHDFSRFAGLRCYFPLEV